MGRGGTKCVVNEIVVTSVGDFLVVAAGVNFKNNQNFNDFVLLLFFGFYFNVLLFACVSVVGLVGEF